MIMSNYAYTEEFPDDIIEEEQEHPARTRAYRRRQREIHIERKEKILKRSRRDNMPAEVDGSDLFYFAGKDTKGLGDCTPWFMYRSRGYLSKGKIHCSCPMCSFSGTTQQDRKSAGKMLADVLEDSRADAVTVSRIAALTV